MKITIAAVGKLKEPFYRAAAAEFEKRLGRYAKLSIIETADEKTPDGAGEGEITQIKNKEGTRLLKYLDAKAYVIALAIDGTMYDSVQFADKLHRLGVEGKSHIVFVIGGSLGLSDAVLKRADLHVSFSKMTFPHQLMRIILLEQIYRGFRISNHEPYHK